MPLAWLAAGIATRAVAYELNIPLITISQLQCYTHTVYLQQTMCRQCVTSPAQNTFSTVQGSADKGCQNIAYSDSNRYQKLVLN